MLWRTKALLAAGIFGLASGCSASQDEGGRTEMGSAGQAAISDTLSQKTIARIAAESPDHTTLVTALKAVSYVDPLANPGPFTVFAPTNDAFDQLPAGTVESLLKPENARQLRTVLLHHVTTSAFAIEDLRDGSELGMVDGGPLTIQRNGEEVLVSGARIVASVRGSNGWVHVVDKVLVPPSK